MKTNVIDEVFTLLKQRKSELPENSYSTKLFVKGENKIIKKLGEEFAELIMAAVKKDKQNFVEESSDVLFHFLALMVYLDIDIEDVYLELKNRQKK
jgi:phosphoribosyl-ATP pyrophosphohydrolase